MKNKKIRISDILLQILIYLSAFITIGLVVGLILYVFIRGIPNISLSMLTTAPSELHGTVGILPMIINTLYMIVLTLLISVPISICTAIYLNEYARKTNKVVKLIEFATQTLAGIPSIIYGLFGYMFFSIFLGFKVSILSGTLTLSIMVLPTLIRTMQESLRSVPTMYREGALGLGAKKTTLIRTILIPSAMPGIISAVILSIGRVVGESAALLFTAGMGYNMPKNFLGHITESGASLTVQLYLYASRGEKLGISFALAAVLIIIVLLINISTRYFSKKFQTK